MSDSILTVNHLSKSFGKNVVLRDIDFFVKKGDVTSIIGASGSGKSTLLRCINLLEIPSAGQILFHEQDIMQRGYNVPAYRAKVGMVFQSFNLFNNMTVSDSDVNIGISVMKGNTALKDALNKVLSGMTADDFNALMAEAISVQPIG